jgi:hypothetical protein
MFELYPTDRLTREYLDACLLTEWRTHLHMAALIHPALLRRDEGNLRGPSTAWPWRKGPDWLTLPQHGRLRLRKRLPCQGRVAFPILLVQAIPL